MTAGSRTTGQTLWVAARTLLVCTLALGVGYTALVTGIGQLALPAQANGSLLAGPGGAGAEAPVGSALIGQSFVDAEGEPLPQYFQPRPSAAGDGYDGAASGASNLGPENPDLVAAVAERRAAIAARDGVPEDAIPVDALTASSSGLDPHISPEYAALQAERVAAARAIPLEEVRALVAQFTEAPDLGVLGSPRVNVLRINLELDEREAAA
ncbi:potassium-transporting ATPase subunit KdpC [Leucobacter chromiireducens]|uniref:Potassium-transporting ATPase KdpC subunit n=1 Tax=Leucobacter chromiireducens subsp. chromiireducens TaxID=660067 RepID=A0ABS1SK86_9MICO|nr:potassium-transporting ATPase subunit KdpC [Leucobacter chromiireducens]MBL3688404.1 potassium-transporting ATPase subunit KdpC [Leucobacter chromiireducens subsp. chromiireducens]